jgi:NAD(P) transhydrogenase subunit alpha
MNPNQVADEAARLAAQALELANHAKTIAIGASQVVAPEASPFIFLLAIFLMACFVGYYVVWNVTPALHSPLMAVTNGISSVIIVGALIAAGPIEFDFSKIMGLVAVALAAVNICGGFLVTHRMLSMFKKKEPAKGAK